MNYEEALAYLNDYGWSNTKFGLSRTFELLAGLGDPQKKLRFVHVAGTNGKGSTCAMAAQILQSAGYRTGLYISPFIQDFCERIQVNGQPIPHEAIAEITEKIHEISEGMEEHPSHFEMITAIGMEYFAREHCDIVVLEVGMGGEFDSTNVIDPPEVAVITNIGLDHTEYLGNTIEAIAATKGGIIKTGCSCVCYNGDARAVQVITELCRERNVPLVIPANHTIEPLGSSLDGQRFTYRGQEHFLRLLGAHQLQNAAVVLEVIGLLRDKSYKISDEAVAEGLRLVKWPARFEVLRREPLFLLDGGHNPQCAEALTACLREYLPGKKVTFLMGMLKDKDYPAVVDIVAPFAERFVCIRPDSRRALEPAVLAELAREHGVPAQAFEDTAAAVEYCKALTDCPVVAFGSLYAAGEIRTLMGLKSGE